MPRFLALVLVALLVASSAGLAAADAEGNPVLSVHLPDNRVDVGAETSLDLFVLNGGEIDTGGPPSAESRVTTARQVRVTVRPGSAPLDVETSTRPVGNVPEGVVGPVSFAVTVDESAPPGTYRLPVTVAYVYTSEVETGEDDPDHFERSETLETSVEVVVEERADFEVVDVNADFAVGETGTLSLSVRNTGGAAATAASVTVRSDDPSLTFGGSATAAVFVGEWAPGEVRDVSVSASVAPGADARPYPLSVSVGYRDADGVQRESAADTAGAQPRVEQTFELSDVTSTLAVGDEGTLRGTITNTGPAPARNAVVIFSADNPNVAPVETEFAVGDLGPGESATFTFDAEVSDSADAGPRQLTFEVRYRDASDDVRRSDPLDARVEVGSRRDVFAVETVTRAVTAGESGVLELRVTNTGDEPVTDVSAKLFTDDPLSSSDDEAFVDRLGPGESTTVRFALSAAPDALAKVYPVSLDFQYDDAEGDTRLSDTFDVPVQVSENQDGGGLPIPLLVGAVVVVVVLGVGLWLWRRG